MYEKILVTGGTGLIGQAVGSIQSQYPESEFIFWGSRDCDLTKEEESLECVRAIKPDAIIHLAAIVLGIGTRTMYPVTILRKSLAMNFNILEAARLSDVKKVVMTLSSGMYPNKAPLPYREEYIHDGAPDGHNYGYIHSKRFVEPMVKAYRKEFGLHVIGLVPNWLFGENDNYSEDAGVLPALIRRFCDNRNTDDEIVVWGDGSPLREYTHCEDVARSYLWCLENYDSEQILNIGTIEENSVKDMAFMIADFLGIDKRRIVFDTSKPKGALKKSTDNSRFVDLSNFTYMPFKAGLERTLKWYLDTLASDPSLIRTRSKQSV